MYDAQGFIHCLLNSCLPTPSNNFASEDSIYLSAFLPRVRGKKVCPLCGDPEPDDFHYAALCPVTEAPRKELASTVASFLLGLGVAADYDMQYVHQLLDWFTSQVSGEPSDSNIFVEPHGLSGNVGLRVLLGESEQGLKPPATAVELRAEKFTRLISLRRARLAGRAPTPPAPTVPATDPSDNSWAASFKWPLLLCTASRFLDMCNTKGRIRLRALITFPRGRFPLSFSDSRTVFSSDAVCLCLLTSELLPPLIPDNIPLLAGIISSNTLFGTWGIALSWNRTSWSLDTAPLVDQKSILERFEMLPPAPPRPVKGVWSAGRTWYGLLPRELPLAWEEATEHLSSSARAKAKLCLSQTITAGQKLSWEISADLIHQFLVRAKRMATAKAKGKKLPRWRPLFTKKP